MYRYTLPENPHPGFAALGAPRRIWAVSAIHGETERLMALHDALYDEIMPGDRLVYTGNYGGYGASAVQTIDELLTFRRMVLARPGMMADDIVYLRGCQEDMWHRLLQISFAPDPYRALCWMLERGLGGTLASYGISPEEGLDATRKGTVMLTRWTARIRDAIRQRPGHETFITQWRRAAYSGGAGTAALLFVNAGINPSLPLPEQGDYLWWSGAEFNDINKQYDPFCKVVRGFDPVQRGINLNCVTATIDGGCGFGGNLVCGIFDNTGQIVSLIKS